MKRLLTTVLVLAMITTMFCVYPVVSAAVEPTMEVSIVNNASANDPISATFTNVSDAKWVVWSIKADSTGEYVFVDEKRGNKVAAEGFNYTFSASETALKSLVNFTVEAKITGADGTVTTLTTPVVYRSFGEVQGIIRDVLADPQVKTISQAKDLLMFTLPEYYLTSYDADIVAALRTTFATALANPYNPDDVSTHIDPKTFADEIIEEVLLAAINCNNKSAIADLLNTYYADVTISLTDKEKIWYDASAKKDDIATKLATYEYATVADFTSQFKSLAFLDKLSSTNAVGRIEFLRNNNNTYLNYGTATTITGGTVTNLDFVTYDTLATTDTRKEYAGAYMSGTYNNLDDLETRFADLLLALPGINEPVANTPSTPSTPSDVSVGGTVSVGLVNPIVGENALPFTDLDDVEWAKEAIRALYVEGVIDGVSAKQYLPNANVTREQFVKIIVNTFGLKGYGVVTSLTDVNQNEWYAPFINIAVELGIINGVSSTEFGVGQNITRQDMTVIMHRVAKYIGKDITSKSSKKPTDMSSVDAYAEEAVISLYQAGIINGVAEGVFAGWQTATRAQAAKLCYDLRESK